MLEHTHDPQAVTRSVRLYRRLVSAYPADFRREYGEPMLQVFRDSCMRAILEGGRLALLALWARTGLDYLKTLIEEYARGGTNMTREKFIKLSGWALVFGSVALFVGWMASTRPDYNQYNAASLPIDRYANIASPLLMFLGILLLSLGLLGLLARYGSEAGGFGRFTLGFGALCGAVTLIGGLGVANYDSGPWWYLFLLGWTFQNLMLALFGIVCLRLRILPRWNGLPLLAGIGVPVFVFIAFAYEAITGSWVGGSGAVELAVLLVEMVGFAGLGYLLQADSQPAPPAAGAV